MVVRARIADAHYELGHDGAAHGACVDFSALVGNMGPQNPRRPARCHNACRSTCAPPSLE
jgi:hypothetical protein